MYFAEAALEHLLLEVREEDTVFGPPQQDGPPCIAEDAFWVEGCEVAAFNTMVNKIDRFLTWGASFSIFAQKQTTRNIANAAYLATVVVLRTDVLKPPKPSTRSRDSSSKGKWSARLPGVSADRPRSEWSAQPCSGGGLPTGRFWAE